MQQASGFPSVRGLSWVTALCLLGDAMLYIVLPLYWDQFGLDALWQVGVLLSINRFIRLPLNPLVGWLYIRVPKRTGVVIAAAAAVVTTVGYGLVSGFVPFLIARMVWGAAWSMLRIGGYLTVLEAAGQDGPRGKLLGSYNGIIGVGSLIGMLAGGMLAEVLGPREVALMLGIITAAGLPLAWRHVPATTAAVPGSARSAPLWKLPPAGWLPLLSGFLTAAVFMGMLLATLSPLIASHLPEGTELLGLAVGAATVAGAVQALRWGWSPFLSPWFGRLSDGPRGRLPLYLAALALAAGGFALLPLGMPLAAWLAVLLSVMLANTAITTLTDALAADAASGRSAAAYMTTYTTVVDIGAAAGPLAAYALAGTFGLGAVSFTCAAFMALVASAWLLYGRSCAVTTY
ncbi:MFS transporter [Paenibacillus silviterrae]|uniref:MFS transporter n=1 Tax=Paenibacillus silviterrae TaxID=3242194 RepID=UPI0025437B6C|nr:MFS transporter [Paenibacillus chinjuensis]